MSNCFALGGPYIVDTKYIHIDIVTIYTIYLHGLHLVFMTIGNLLFAFVA